jgi:pyruvate dehydrogenase E1 component
MTDTLLEPPTRVDAALAAIEDRVLWLAMNMIDHANRVRPNPTGLKVGGHQSSSASMATLMTALWFEHLRAEDRVSVKPHASPVLHAINYLLGSLDEEYLTSLRRFGGLQSYPSRTKDPDPVDYSTGSVGIGATAPIWGTLARRYVDGHFGGAGSGRQYSLVGDAELDEGACWEAILDPAVIELGEVVWIVDLNRQSLDRVPPNRGTQRFMRMFDAAGWQVLSTKYGSRLREAFAAPNGAALRDRIDDMGNAEFQRLLRRPADQVRKHLIGDDPAADAVEECLAAYTDAEVFSLIRNLGGHDVSCLRRTFAEIDDTRPTVIFAYTIKGYRLASEGHPQNHSALLSSEQLAELRIRLGADADSPWAGFPDGSLEAQLCAETAERLSRESRGALRSLQVPVDFCHVPHGTGTTQAALGRTLMDVSREAPDVARRVVTVSPDVSSSTNLAGWVNKVGVWSPDERPDWFADDGETLLHWRESPRGQHVQLGIAEVNLVGALAELGSTWSRWAEPLLPIGVVYDPFVERALEPWSFGIYSGGQSILVGTPSGVSLAPEGGAHQSVKTPSIGVEQPGCTYFEPAFAIEVEWMLLEAMSRLGRADGSSTYLRLSTRPVPQDLAAIPTDPAARERRRRQVLAGAYALRRAEAPSVTLCAAGALVPETIAASDRLTELGVPNDVIVVTSPDRLFKATQGRCGLNDEPSWVLDEVFPSSRACPMVTAMDGHPHTLAFLPAVNQVRSCNLGVARFGQSGDLASVYAYAQIDADALVRAALGLVD